MAKRLFDTNYLITHWKDFPEKEVRTEEAMRQWARKLIELHDAKYICTPVLIEMLAGTRNQQELQLHRAYLSEFTSIDDRNIPPSVWDKAQQFAQRVSTKQDAKRRQMADCLIRAIAEHYHCELLTQDQGCRRLRTP